MSVEEAVGQFRYTPDHLREFEGQMYVFTDAFKEAKTMEPRRIVRGLHYKEFNDLLQRCTELRDSIRPNLPDDILMPTMYRSEGATRRYNSLSTRNQILIRRLTLAKIAAVDELARKYVPEIATQTIAPGTLDVPEYFRQSDQTSCTSTTYFMVAQAILKYPVLKHVFQYAVIDAFGHRMRHDDDYLNMFCSDTFQSVAERDIEAVSLSGVDFDVIAKLVTNIRKLAPDKSVFCVVNLQTNPRTEEDDLGFWEDIWHSNVLLSVNETHVEVHDPSDKRHGEAHKLVDKEEFIRRWGQAYFRAHLIIA